MPIVEVLFEPQPGLHEVSDVMVITADSHPAARRTALVTRYQLDELLQRDEAILIGVGLGEDLCELLIGDRIAEALPQMLKLGGRDHPIVIQVDHGERFLRL
jgi:hypothetical protein